MIEGGYTPHIVTIFGNWIKTLFPVYQHVPEDLLHQFTFLHREIVCAHQPDEAAIIANTIFDPATPPGPVVELGAYKGGMTAKLSLACLHTNRDFYVFDTFTGLPHNESQRDTKGSTREYHVGEYSGTIEEVERAILRAGGHAQLIQGDIADTLPQWPVNPAVVFMDLDLIQSASTALRLLWPRMVPGGTWYTHEAGSRGFVEAITRLVPETPLWGAGHGMGPHAANLAYWIKPLTSP